MEKRAKYAKLHPEMSNLDLTKILSKKYKELPERKKVSATKIEKKKHWVSFTNNCIHYTHVWTSHENFPPNSEHMNLFLTLF